MKNIGTYFAVALAGVGAYFLWKNRSKLRATAEDVRRMEEQIPAMTLDEQPMPPTPDPYNPTLRANPWGGVY